MRSTVSLLVTQLWQLELGEKSPILKKNSPGLARIKTGLARLFFGWDAPSSGHST